MGAAELFSTRSQPLSLRYCLSLQFTLPLPQSLSCNVCPNSERWFLLEQLLRDTCTVSGCVQTGQEIAAGFMS